MTEIAGTTGLILNEPLLWEKGKEGREGYSMPRRDVPVVPLDFGAAESSPDIPDLSEIDVVRHYTRLSQWNFGVDTGMYPLGSCTMKYNPKTNERQASLEGFAGAHPLVPEHLNQGILRLLFELQGYLCEITGMDAATLQPAAGAQGELTGMLVIHAYYAAKGERRSKIIVPDTAHGTNPASAALCGFKAAPVASSADGLLTAEAVAALMDEETAGIMVTNPNTLGFFETNLPEIAEVVHAKGGVVYCDGANMNAVMGIVKMGRIGADIMHLNLHKTFSTPHGGGGPGAGPICVKAYLAPYLPEPRIIHDHGEYRLSEDFPQSIGRIHSFMGNVGVMIKAYSYIRTMGAEYLKRASELAVLNANYLKERLKGAYHLAYDRPCMHECVFSDRYQAVRKIKALDIAKALMDFGFHPPTIYFPLVVPGALMVEPTETESKEDIDRLISAFLAIAEQAEENPEQLLESPRKTKVRRLDETQAARKPCLAG
ncbi:MAG: aminomethyl-transferring glycine dehydrogenase subunit GcvPB [Deltaproteobacteria bacterium]|nr:aminomethyl-transferring glycine dehydrogenase subunit GcvPB [Deltaproteobacteria bacterium]